MRLNLHNKGKSTNGSKIMSFHPEMCLPASWQSLYGTVHFESGALNSLTNSSGQCPWYTVNGINANHRSEVKEFFNCLIVLHTMMFQISQRNFCVKILKGIV